MHLARSITTRAPALYLLPGIIIGLWLARSNGAAPIWLAAGALLALLLSWWGNRHESRKLPWAGFFTLGTVLAFWAYGNARFPSEPDVAALSSPEREATLILDVKRVYGGMTVHRNASGIAQVIDANTTSPVKSRSRVYFRVKVPDGEDYQLQRGQRLELTGVLYPIQATVDQDSFEGYLKSIGIHYTFERSSELKLLRKASVFDQFCMRMNDCFDEFLRLGAPANTHLTNIYVAMLLGKKSSLSDEQTERFRMTGTMHFFAISGLHIGVIATVIAQCLLVIRVPRRFSPWIGLPLLYVYVEITGASPSAVRAFLMAACFWLSLTITRQRSPLGALAASAVAVLLLAPEQLWSLGFQLSYTVVLSILLFGLPLRERALRAYSPFRWLPEDNWTNWQRAITWLYDKSLLVFCISFSAWLGSAPLSAGLFGYIAPGAILLNMLLVNLAAIVITGGVIGLSLACLGLPWACGFVNHSAWVCLSIMDAFIQLSLKLPASVIVCEGFPKSVSYLGVIGYIGILFWLHAGKTRFESKAIRLAPVYIFSILAIGLLLSRS
ncbi:MAG: ComEC/Rec2 family competence protein [Opitutaceae bacterium]